MERTTKLSCDNLACSCCSTMRYEVSALEQQNAKLIEALESLTRDSIEMRNKAFKSRVERHTYHPIKNAIDLLGKHDVHVKWGKTLSEVKNA